MEPTNPVATAVIAGLLLTSVAAFPGGRVSADNFLGAHGHLAISPLTQPSFVQRTFRAPLTAYGPGHRGIDLLATDGEPLVSPIAGNISFNGLVALKPEVTVASPDGLHFTLEPACGELPAGSHVSQGSPVGVVCASGYQSHCSPEVCLLFSARNQIGYLSPLWLMGQQSISHLVS